jgi:hypothetical protein
MSLWLRSERGPNRSRCSLAITSCRCSIIASAPERPGVRLDQCRLEHIDIVGELRCCRHPRSESHRRRFANRKSATECKGLPGSGWPLERGWRLRPSRRGKGAMLTHARVRRACRSWRDPSRWTWLSGRRQALILLGRDTEAIRALRAALDANPEGIRGSALLPQRHTRGVPPRRSAISRLVLRGATPLPAIEYGLELASYACSVCRDPRSSNEMNKGLARHRRNRGWTKTTSFGKQLMLNGDDHAPVRRARGGLRSKHRPLPQNNARPRTN